MSAEDTRVAYGARCAWWGTVDETATKPSGLPCCPHCGGVLFEVASEHEWWTGVDAYARRTDDPAYRDFIEWNRGRCYPTAQVARQQFEESRR